MVDHGLAGEEWEEADAGVEMVGRDEGVAALNDCEAAEFKAHRKPEVEAGEGEPGVGPRTHHFYDGETRGVLEPGRIDGDEGAEQEEDEAHDGEEQGLQDPGDI